MYPPWKSVCAPSKCSRCPPNWRETSSRSSSCTRTYRRDHASEHLAPNCGLSNRSLTTRITPACPMDGAQLTSLEQNAPRRLRSSASEVHCAAALQHFRPPMPVATLKSLPAFTVDHPFGESGKGAVPCVPFRHRLGRRPLATEANAVLLCRRRFGAFIIAVTALLSPAMRPKIGSRRRDREVASGSCRKHRGMRRPANPLLTPGLTVAIFTTQGSPRWVNTSTHRNESQGTGHRPACERTKGMPSRRLQIHASGWLHRGPSLGQFAQPVSCEQD